MPSSRTSLPALVLGFFAIASLGSRAEAGFETYTVSTPTQSATDLDLKNFSVKGFDSQGGFRQLESITLSFSDNAYINGSIANHSASSRMFNVNEDVLFNLSFQGTQLLSDDLNAQKGNTPVVSGASLQFGKYQLSGNSGLTSIIDTSMLAAFTDQSSVAFDFTAKAKVTVGGGGGNTSTNISTTADSTLTVTYNYFSPNTTPEPASLAMTILGGLMVASAGYAKNRRKARALAGR